MIANTLEDDMILVIFGSNLIERAGLNLDHTKRLCQAIFRGENYEMTERSGPYEQRLQGWLQDKHAASGEGEKHQIRQRAEVVQHALALRYIVDAIVTRDQPFSEDILKETHRILITGVDHPKYDTPWQEYAGLYRNRVRQPGTGQMGAEVNAGSTHFTASKMVPRAMKRIVDALNDDIAAATEKGVLDPYPLAAKWCAEFVWCHPFLDGNGRLCRLLLNAILLKYAGIVVPIGEHDEERKEYLDIKRRYTTDCEGEGEFASMIMKRATLRLKTMRDRVRKGLDTKASERLLKP